MKKNALYEVETLRTNITPRQFFTYAARMFERKTGEKLYWVDSFEDWETPSCECDIRAKHEDWDTPQYEICRSKPFNFHFYLEGTYNFIMEFDFWDEKTGNGYMYAYEIER